MTQKELKEFLDFQVNKYNQTSFIASDPIQIPHLFSKKEDERSMGRFKRAWSNYLLLYKLF